MAHATPQGTKLLYGFKQPTRFEKGLGEQLPEAYKKFWREWKLTRPTAVHYIPKEQEWQRDEVTGKILPIQDNPIPLIDPPESHKGIWGGESVIKGFQKRQPLKRRVPHFWVPVLKRSVVYSKVLNEYMSMVVTDRTIEKIHESQGFDHYLLQNLACDLRSTLALKLKRAILLELLNGCPKHAQDPQKQQQVLNEYKRYLEQYTAEEIDWYGHTYNEALKKLQAQMRAENPIIPHKVEFRSKLIDQLRQAGVLETKNTKLSTLESTENDTDVNNLSKLDSEPSNKGWFSKINPFGKSN